MRVGIAAKLATLLAVVGMLAAGVTGFYVERAGRAQLLEHAQKQLLTSTQVLARRITSTRQDTSRELEVLTRHPATLATLEHPSGYWDAQLVTLFTLVMQANPAYFQIRLISAKDFGLERVRVDRSSKGPVRVQGDDLQEKGHYDYVSQTLKLPAGATYMSRFAINHERGTKFEVDRPSVQLAMPVMGQAGTALGVVVVNVDVNGWFAALAADLPPDLQLFLANGQGDVLLHPDSSKTFGFERGRRVLIQDEFVGTRDLVNGQVEHVVLQGSWRGQAAGGEVVAAFIAREVEVVSPEVRLILGLAQPLDDLLQETNRLRAAVWGIVLVLCVVCLAAAVFLARAVTRPINAISHAAHRLTQGLSPQGLPVTRSDEIGDLARGFLQMREQITSQLATLQDNQEELEHLAQHDTLTGLPNRRVLQQRIEQALARAGRAQGSVALLFVDLDRFKEINDGLGHDAGDAVLCTVAQRLQRVVREIDTVARLGGDEFVVLLDTPTPLEPLEHLGTVADKLLAQLREAVPFDGRLLQVGASIGISQYPRDGLNANELIAAADRAMYRAKALGRDRYCHASDPSVCAAPGTDDAARADHHLV